MIQRLLWLLGLILLWWWARRLLHPRGQRAGDPPASRGRSGRPANGTAGEPMVRDRICNTFLPRSRALVHRSRGREHYFCSDACRSRFLAGESGSAGD